MSTEVDDRIEEWLAESLAEERADRRSLRRERMLRAVLPQCIRSEVGNFAAPQEAVGRALAIVDEAMRQLSPTPEAVRRPEQAEHCGCDGQGDQRVLEEPMRSLGG
jgi:hypothetical protein